MRRSREWSLPEELVVLILKKLRRRDLRSAGRVDRLWNKVSKLEEVRKWILDEYINKCKNKRIKAIYREIQGNVGQDSRSVELLEHALRGHFIYIVRELLLKGAPVNARLSDGTTPLHLSCLEGNDEFSRCLINAGADVNAVDDSGSTALHIVCEDHWYRISLVELLTRAGADMSAKDKWTRTPLHLACFPHKTELLDYLLWAGADINTRTEFGATPLWFACYLGIYRSVEVLLDAGADIRYPGKHGEEDSFTTPLEIAEIKGFTGIASLITSHDG